MFTSDVCRHTRHLTQYDMPMSRLINWCHLCEHIVLFKKKNAIVSVYFFICNIKYFIQINVSSSTVFTYHIIPSISIVILPLPGDYISTMYTYVFSLILQEVIFSHLITGALNVLILSPTVCTNIKCIQGIICSFSNRFCIIFLYC